MPITFQDLPIDLLPCILQWLSFRLLDLSRISQVNKIFRQAALPFLYERIRVRDLTRLKLLFQTLANNPSLCTYLRRLELRVWPLATNDPHREALERQVLIVLHHAENLKRLDFTRRGSMTDKMFAVVAERSNLEILEVNGSPLYFSPSAILRLPPRLRSLQVILPTREVMDFLPAAIEGVKTTLTSLTLLGSKSTCITNGFLQALIPLNLSLSSLTLAGCPRLTDDPLLELLKQQGPNLRSLALEALGFTSMFLDKLAQRVALGDLQAFKTTLDPRVALLGYPDPSFASMAKLVASCPNLTSFGFYCSGHQMDRFGALTYPVVPTHFILSLIRSPCASKLTTFECYGVVFPVQNLETLCTALHSLENLGLHVWAWDQKLLQQALNTLERLQTLHLLSVKETERHQIDELMQRLDAPEIKQFGVRNRVWDIGRQVDSEGRIHKSLEPFDWSSQQIPSIFTFIRS